MKSTKLYVIYDGEHTWVSAYTKAKALKVMYDELGTSKFDHDIEYVRRVSKEEAQTLNFYGEDHKRVSSMWDEFQRDTSERMVGCSGY